MHFVRIGDRAINLDNVAQIELRSYNDGRIAKVYFVGQGHNRPCVLREEEAKELNTLSTMSPNDPSVLPDVNGIQAVSKARTH